MIRRMETPHAAVSSLRVDDGVVLAAVQDASRRYAVPFGPP
jgi:hypothetical protein